MFDLFLYSKYSKYLYVLQGRTSEDLPKSSSSTKGVQLVQSSKKENVIEKTLDQLKDATTV